MKITEFLKIKFVKLALALTALIALAIPASAFAIPAGAIRGQRQLRRVPGPPVYHQRGRAP